MRSYPRQVACRWQARSRSLLYGFVDLAGCSCVFQGMLIMLRDRAQRLASDSAPRDSSSMLELLAWHSWTCRKIRSARLFKTSEQQTLNAFSRLQQM